MQDGGGRRQMEVGEEINQKCGNSGSAETIDGERYIKLDMSGGGRFSGPGDVMPDGTRRPAPSYSSHISTIVNFPKLMVKTLHEIYHLNNNRIYAALLIPIK